jgi:hypothetical protein
METTFYYTFSTIAQALAAVIALLGAFVLYRAQLLGSDLAHASAVIRTHSQLDAVLRAKLDAAFIAGDHAEVFSLAKNAQPKPERTEVIAGLVTFEKLKGDMKSLLWSFVSAVVASIIVIGGSVVALAYTPNLARQAHPGYYLVAGYVAFCICLLLYGRLMLKQLPWPKA